MTFVDLVLDTGELVRIECPNKHHDALYDSLENAMKRRDWWAPGRFDGCKAELMGIRLDRVAMGRVVGML
jgi:hypothetical protein